MTPTQKERLFRRAARSAAVLYGWGLFIIWWGPVWELGSWTYYLLGVLPVGVGVVALSIALGLYMDLRKQE
jgi:fucose permease